MIVEPSDNYEVIFVSFSIINITYLVNKQLISDSIYLNGYINQLNIDTMYST